MIEPAGDDPRDPFSDDPDYPPDMGSICVTYRVRTNGTSYEAKCPELNVAATFEGGGPGVDLEKVFDRLSRLVEDELNTASKASRGLKLLAERGVSVQFGISEEPALVPMALDEYV